MARYWVGALVVAILAGLGGGVASILLNRPHYTSSATIALRAVEEGSTSAGAQSIVQQMSASALTLFTSPRTLVPAGESLNPRMSATQLQQVLSVQAQAQSLVFSARITTNNAQRSQAAMEAVTGEFRKALEAGGVPSFGNVSLEVGDIAITTEPAPASLMGRVAGFTAGVALGLLAGFLYLFVRVLLNDRVWDAADVRELTDDAVIGAGEQGGLSSLARTVADGLPFFMPSPGSNTIAIASVDGSASALAREVARQVSVAGDTVALVDADLEARPLGDRPGLADHIAGLLPAADATVPSDGVDLVAAGGPAPNPVDLLTRSAAAEFLSGLAATHRWVIVSAAAMTGSSAGVLGAKLASTTLLTVTPGRTTRHQIRETLNLSEATGLPVAGILVH
ncbi:MAG: hypothetical protein Q3997_07935 [Propionibacteriaceae bacterium]|nr:hypothetical protein [Propionibacteriaceae bacterium]